MFMPCLRRTSVFLFIAILLILPAGVALGALQDHTAASEPTASVKKNLEHFNKTSEEFYQQVMDQKLQEALVTMQLLEKQVTAIQFSGVAKLEGVEALFASILEAKRLLASIAPNQKENVMSAAKIRLAADALMHRSQPMWHQYYRVLQKDLKELKAANNEKQAEGVRLAYAGFKQHYEIIRPSLLISEDPAQGEKFAALFATLDEAIKDSGVHLDRVDQLIPALSSLVDETFERENEAAYVPLPESQRPALVTAVFGSIIVAVLAYVGWRKYRFDQGYVNVSGKGPRT